MMAQPIIRILKRQPNSEPCLSDLPNDISKKNDTKNRPIKTLEEREAAYAEARKRILGSSQENWSQDILNEIESNENTKISIEGFTTPSQLPATTFSTTAAQMESHINKINLTTTITQPQSLKAQLACCQQLAPCVIHTTKPDTIAKDILATVPSTNSYNGNNLGGKNNQFNNVNAQEISVFVNTCKPINNIVLELNTPATDNTRKPKNHLINNSIEKSANTLKCDTNDTQPLEATAALVAETPATNLKPLEINDLKNRERQKSISFQPIQSQPDAASKHEYDLKCCGFNESNNIVLNNVDKTGSIHLVADDNMHVQLTDSISNGGVVPLTRVIPEPGNFCSKSELLD